MDDHLIKEMNVKLNNYYNDFVVANTTNVIKDFVIKAILDEKREILESEDDFDDKLRTAITDIVKKKLTPKTSFYKRLKEDYIEDYTGEIIKDCARALEYFAAIETDSRKKMIVTKFESSTEHIEKPYEKMDSYLQGYQITNENLKQVYMDEMKAIFSFESESVINDIKQSVIDDIETSQKNHSLFVKTMNHVGKAKVENQKKIKQELEDDPEMSTEEPETDEDVEDDDSTATDTDDGTTDDSGDGSDLDDLGDDDTEEPEDDTTDDTEEPEDDTDDDTDDSGDGSDLDDLGDDDAEDDKDKKKKKGDDDGDDINVNININKESSAESLKIYNKLEDILKKDRSKKSKLATNALEAIKCQFPITPIELNKVDYSFENFLHYANEFNSNELDMIEARLSKLKKNVISEEDYKEFEKRFDRVKRESSKAKLLMKKLGISNESLDIEDKTDLYINKIFYKKFLKSNISIESKLNNINLNSIVDKYDKFTKAAEFVIETGFMKSKQDELIETGYEAYDFDEVLLERQYNIKKDIIPKFEGKERKALETFQSLSEMEDVDIKNLIDSISYKDKLNTKIKEQYDTVGPTDEELFDEIINKFSLTDPKEKRIVKNTINGDSFLDENSDLLFEKFSLAFSNEVSEEDLNNKSVIDDINNRALIYTTMIYSIEQLGLLDKSDKKSLFNYLNGEIRKSL